MRKKLALSQDKEYIYIVHENSKGSVIEKQIYGGKDSKSVPCGFITQMIFLNKHKSRKRRNKMNDNYFSNLIKRTQTVKSSTSSQHIPNG